MYTHLPVYVCVPGVHTHAECHTGVMFSAMLSNNDEAQTSPYPSPVTITQKQREENRQVSTVKEHVLGKWKRHPEQAYFYVHIPEGPGCSYVWENVPFPPGWPLIAFDGFLPERWVLLPGRSLRRSGIDFHQILLLHLSHSFKTVANMCNLFKQHWGN